MIQLTIIRIEGYGPWTVTLGSDREAQLQMLQAKIYHDVQCHFSEKNCIVYFNRFDEYFAVTNGLDVSGHVKIQKDLASAFPDLKMSMAIGTGKTAFEASLNAYDARKREVFADRAASIFGTSKAADTAQIMHVDVDSSTKVGDTLSPYE
ncbi:MAG: GTP cyclohydrolase IIa, partial [Nitrososphaera sp.]